MFTTVYSCLRMFTTVYSCLFTHVSPSLLVFTYVCTCLPLLASLLVFTCVYLCLPMFTHVYLFSMITRACLPMFTHYGVSGSGLLFLKGVLGWARIYLPSQHSSSGWSIRFSFNNNMGMYAHKDYKVLLITSSPHTPHLLTRKYTSQHLHYNNYTNY